jgi:hypothetical protein
MAYSYYIYYRVAPQHEKTCEARVLDLFSTLKQSTAIAGRLLRKRSEPLLWMEVYDNVRDDAKFELELTQATAQLGLTQYLQEGTNRRVECFEA